jgi:hypothetical protein
MKLPTLFIKIPPQFALPCGSATAPSQLKLTKPAAGLLQRIVIGQMLSPWQLLQSEFSCFSLYLKLVEEWSIHLSVLARK